MTRNNFEFGLQCACCEWLDLHSNLRYFSVPNDLFQRSGPSAARTIAKFKRSGLKAGVPDLIVLGKEPLFLELKSPKGQLSTPQQKWRDWLTTNKYNYSLIRSIEDLVVAVKKFC